MGLHRQGCLAGSFSADIGAEDWEFGSIDLETQAAVGNVKLTVAHGKGVVSEIAHQLQDWLAGEAHAHIAGGDGIAGVEKEQVGAETRLEARETFGPCAFQVVVEVIRVKNVNVMCVPTTNSIA